MRRVVFLRRLTVAGAIALFLLSGCATYTKVRSPYRHRKTGLQVVLPTDWLRYTPDRPDLTLTRNGLQLERISVVVTKCGKELTGTARVYRVGMLPNEIAELSLGLIESSEVTRNFKIESVDLVRIAGRDGYQAEAVYVDKTGLPKRLRIVGFGIGNYVCELRYSAADAAYFEKYEPAFDAVVTSVRVAARK